MKTKGTYGVTSVIKKEVHFSFESEEDVDASLNSAMELHKMFLLLVLSAVSYISPDNKKGVDIDYLFFFISSFTNILSEFAFALVVNYLFDYGFLREKGARADYFLVDKCAGEYAKAQLMAKFPDTAHALKQLVGIGIDNIRKEYESDMSDTKH